MQDNLSFPLICPDWNADEEMLLLEVCDMSMGNSYVFFLLSHNMLRDEAMCKKLVSVMDMNEYSVLNHWRKKVSV